jgi:hypothetical protein
MEITKTCTKCKEEKPLSEYYLLKKDGALTRNACKICVCKRTRFWNPSEHSKKAKRIYQVKYTKINAEEIKRKRFLNRDIKIIQDRNYYKNNKQLFLEKMSLRRKKTTSELADTYIRTSLKALMPSLKIKDIPQELIELKRIQIKTHRLCQQLQN